MAAIAAALAGLVHPVARREVCPLAVVALTEVEAEAEEMMAAQPAMVAAMATAAQMGFDQTGPWAVAAVSVLAASAAMVLELPQVEVEAMPGPSL